jgi:hypothetical protein
MNRISKPRQFEQRIEQLVEGSFARLFAGRLHPREVATHLARAMEDHARQLEDGTSLAPDIYLIRLNPADHTALLNAQPRLAESLAQAVINLANRFNMRLLNQPKIDIAPDESVVLRAVIIGADHGALPDTRSTQVLQPISPAQAPSAPRNPQLIIQGTRYVPLDRPVVNIGRRRDNHIVIDDPRVSRQHAQIRLRFGSYIIYDLGSSGGTFVNESYVSESILKPGDVISLAGVLLVYIDDESTTSSMPGVSKDTQIKEPTQDNDPTV